MKKFAGYFGRFSFISTISGTFLLLATMLSILGWMTVSTLEDAKASLSDVYVNHVAPTSTLQQLVIPVRDVAFRMVAFTAGQLPAAGCSSKLDDASNELVTQWKKFLQQTGSIETETELISAIEKGLGQFETFKVRLKEDYSKGNTEAVAKLFEDEWPTIQADLLSPIQKLVVTKEASVKSTYENVVERARASRYKALTVVIAAAILLTISFVIVLRMAGKLRKFGENADRLNSETELLQGQSSRFLLASQNLAQASIQQTSAFEQTKAAMTEMDATIKNNSDFVQTSVRAAEKCEERARSGTDSVSRMLESIDKISVGNTKILSQIDDGNRQIAEIVRVIEAIGNKTKVINDIVFQTKLLSFNASVEAARAGEQGRGFSVVAEEVGNLARMSGQAAAEISNMLNDSTKRVREIVEKMGQQIQALIVDGNQGIDEGKRVAQECDGALRQIALSVGEMSKAIQSISASTNEQSKAISEVSSAVTEASGATRTNSANSAEIASEAEALAEKSEFMASLVNDLNSLIKGVRRATVEPGNKTDQHEGNGYTTRAA